MKHAVSDLEGDDLDAAVALADGRLVTGDEPRWKAGGSYVGLRQEYGGRHVVRWYSESGELCGWEPLDNQGSPSREWNVGGPIIERERIATAHFDDTDIGGTECGWSAGLVDGGGYFSSHDFRDRGPTPLIAAMRCYVRSKLGDEVELPD